MIKGERFSLVNDNRFKELPALTKFRARKMEGEVGRKLLKSYEKNLDEAKLKKSLGITGIEKFYLEKDVPVNFHNNFVDINPTFIGRRRSKQAANKYLDKIS